MGMFLNKDSTNGWKTVSAAYINISSTLGWKKIVQGWINISGQGWKKFIGGTATGIPVGSGTPTIERPDTATYKWAVKTLGTWTQSPYDYRYQWQRSTDNSTWYDISSATLDNYTYSSYKTQYVRVKIWASNEFGESTTFLVSGSSINYYAKPTTSLVATGGQGKITITPTWSSDDPNVSGVVKVGTTTVTNSGSGVAFDSTQAAGDYTVSLTATNSANLGGSYSSTSTSGTVTVTAVPVTSVTTNPSLSGTYAAGNAITASAGTYSNATVSETKIAYSTSSTAYTSGTLGTTAPSLTKTSPYTITSTDAASPSYYYWAYDKIVGSNGTTYYVFGSIFGLKGNTPSTPTLNYISLSGSNYNYTATWTNSTVGGSPITYHLHCYGSSNNYATIQYTRGPFTSGTTAQSFQLPTTSGLWKVAVFARNPIGDSTDSSLSAAK